MTHLTDCMMANHILHSWLFCFEDQTKECISVGRIPIIIPKGVNMCGNNFDQVSASCIHIAKSFFPLGHT
jgi:hypothetical protein